MNDTVKRFMGLAMLCAAHREIPMGDSVDDADGKIEITWNGEKLTFRLFDPESKQDYFSCVLNGEPTCEDAESILRLAFGSSMLDVPKDTIAKFVLEYERDD